MIRVLLADDQALIRAGFHVLIDATSFAAPMSGCRYTPDSGNFGPR